MKKIIPLMIINLAFLAACDSPRSQRSLSSSYSKNGLTSVNLDTPTTPTTPPTTPTTPPTTTPDIPTDAAGCKFSTDGATGFESTSPHLGDYSLCQGTDKNNVYFQLKTAPTNTSGDISICLIPTTSSGANSIYVGNPMCGYFKDPKAVRKITFIKYPQYANSTINGVIFFKDTSWLYPVYYKFTYGYGYYPVYNNYINTLDAYRLCMNMLSEINNASNCNAFKSVGQYVFKQF